MWNDRALVLYSNCYPNPAPIEQILAKYELELVDTVVTAQGGEDSSASSLTYFGAGTTPTWSGAVTLEGPGALGKSALMHLVDAANFQIVATTFSANVIPEALGANWWSLVNSSLPEGTFKELMSAAMSPTRLFGPYLPLSSKSLDTFLSLWKAAKDVAVEPAISVTPTGCVVAEWYEDDDNSLAILSNDGDVLHYSLFESGQIIEGTTSKAQIPAFVADMRSRAQNPFTRSDA